MAYQLGSMLKSLREWYGFSINEFADAVKIKAATYARIEDDRYNPSESEIMEICRFSSFIQAERDDLMSMWQDNKKKTK